MTEVPGTDRDEARDNVLHETPLVPEDVEDDPRSTSSQDHRGDAGQTGDDVKPSPGGTELGT